MLLNAYRSWVHSVKHGSEVSVEAGSLRGGGGVILNTAYPAISVGELRPPTA